MDKTMYDTAKKIIQSAIDKGMEVSEEELAWLKEADQEYSVEKMTVADVSEKLDAALNRPVQVVVNVDNSELIAMLKEIVNRPAPTPIVTLNAPPNPPVVVNAQVTVPETVLDTKVERDQNGLITATRTTRKKKVG